MRDDSAGSWSEGRIHRLIFEHSSEALAVIDDDGRLVTVSVRHDLNSARTTSLFGASPLASDVPGQERATQPPADIRHSAEHAAGLVRRVLSFIRRPASPPERVNVGAALAEMGAILELVLGKGIRLALEIEPEVGDALLERDQLDRVLVGLARTAREATPHGGTLPVAAANGR